MSTRLLDRHSRVVEYLRVSVTDRCNMRCAYCSPSPAVAYRMCDILRYEDLLRLLGIFASMGVRKVRLTGGEPLIRSGIIGFIHQVSAIPGIEKIALTTNGVKLEQMAPKLKRAGVSGVNISLDTLKRDKFISITGRDGLASTLAGIESALSAGIGSVKINMVVMRGVNDDEVVRFALRFRDRRIQVRFLEFMPATPEVWDESMFVPMSDVKSRIEKLGRLVECEKAQWGGPAKIYRLEGFRSEIGFISPVSRHFCGECNRLRLTSAGILLTCLFAGSSADLGGIIRSGGTDVELEEAILEALNDKNAVRNMSRKNMAPGALFPMSRVGG